MGNSLCAGLSSPFLLLDLLLLVTVKLHMLCFHKWEFYFCSFLLHFPKIKYIGLGKKSILLLFVKENKVMWGQLFGHTRTDFLIHDLTSTRDFISMSSVHSYRPKRGVD